MEQTYNRAKPWQLLFFVFNNTASNIYLSLMGFVNLYAGNVAGMRSEEHTSELQSRE